MAFTQTNTIVHETTVPPKQDSVGHKYDFDPVALRKKYDYERDKRLQHNIGVDQYRRVDNEFAHMLNDPYCANKTERKPSSDLCDVVVVGGGYGGELIAYELLQKGITNIRIIEKGSDFGGTWYWNRYPGAQCDIESYVYMPLLDETGYVPTWKYAGGKELFKYAQDLGTRFGLYDKALFQTEVKEMHWIDDASRWKVVTDRGDNIMSRFVIPAAGPLHRPKLPGIPGLGSFKGHTFHTSRWDFGYTGGDVSGNLEKLQDKRVGVIGTGATSVQIIPHLGRWSKQLTVFQRTPSSIDIRGNHPTDPEWAKSLQPQWHQQRMDNFNILVNGGKQEVDLVSDGWTDIIRKIGNSGALYKHLNPEQRAEAKQMVDFEKMEQIRHRVEDTITDKETAEHLKPWYNQFCKRPCFHDDYLPAFNRPNVELVDTDGRGVEAITEQGVIANGKLHELDCLIFATGFELGTSWSERSGIDVYGRDNLSLKKKWQDGPSTLYGLTSRDFPNCFFVSNMQAGLSPNFLHVTGEQAKLIAYVIRKCEDEGVNTVEPTQQAEDDWVQTIVESTEKRRAFRQSCTPGYYNNEGRMTSKQAKSGAYGGGALEFLEIIHKWQDEDKLAGMDVRMMN